MPSVVKMINSEAPPGNQKIDLIAGVSYYPIGIRYSNDLNILHADDNGALVSGMPVATIRPDISAEQITSVSSFANPLSSTNPIHISVKDELDRYDNLSYWFDANTKEVIGNIYWKTVSENQSTGRIIDFFEFKISFKIISFSERQISLQIPEAVVDAMDNYFNQNGIRKPTRGLISIGIRIKNNIGIKNDHIVFLMQYSDALPFVIQQAPPIIGVTSIEDVDGEYITPAETFETLFIPSLTGSFTYNFFEEEEENQQRAQSLNYEGISLENIPMYVNLAWSKSPKEVVFRSETITGPLGQGIEPEQSSETPATLAGVTTDPTSGDNSFTIKLGSDRLYGTPVRLLSDIEPTGYVKTNFSDGGTVFSQPTSSPTNQFTSLRGGVGVTSGFEQETEDIGNDPRNIGASQVSGIVNENGELLDEFVNLISESIITLSGIASQYVGYLITKEKYSEDENRFVFFQNILIKNREKVFFTDYNVAYGQTYRYRIRTVFKFVNRHNLPVVEDTNAIINEPRLENIYKIGQTYASRIFFFDSDPSPWLEFTCVDTIRPDCPYNIHIVPNSIKKHILITWNQKNQDKDIIGYNIYRKTNNGNFFLLNNSLIDLRKNYYIDSQVNTDDWYIYTLEAVDVHGFRSKLSAQIKTKLKEREYFAKERSEFQQKLVDFPNLEFDEIVSKKPKDRVFFNKRVNLVINPLYNNTADRDNFSYILKFVSLDTTIKKEIKINFKTKRIIH